MRMFENESERVRSSSLLSVCDTHPTRTLSEIVFRPWFQIKLLDVDRDTCFGDSEVRGFGDSVDSVDSVDSGDLSDS